jgi:hypothetical protein
MVKIENTYQKSTKNFTIMVLLAFMLFFGNSFGELKAQPAPTPSGAPNGAAPEGTDANVVCQFEMGKYMEATKSSFRDFLTTNFQNKSGTGSLLATAFAKYREVRDGAYAKYAAFYPQQGAFQLTEGIETGACQKTMETGLEDMRRELTTRAQQTSTVKKTTALLEKYQKINTQLRVLNSSFLKMKSFLDTFSQKLPCYLKDSCNKG